MPSGFEQPEAPKQEHPSSTNGEEQNDERILESLQSLEPTGDPCVDGKAFDLLANNDGLAGAWQTPQRALRMFVSIRNHVRGNLARAEPNSPEHQRAEAELNTLERLLTYYHVTAEDHQEFDDQEVRQETHRLTIMRRQLETFAPSGDLLKDMIAYHEITAAFHGGSAPRMVQELASGRHTPEHGLALERRFLEEVMAKGMRPDKEVADGRYYHNVLLPLESEVIEKIAAASNTHKHET